MSGRNSSLPIPVIASTSNTRIAGTRSHWDTAPRLNPRRFDSATTPPTVAAIALTSDFMPPSIARLNTTSQASLNPRGLGPLYHRRMSLGTRIRQARKAKKLTQEQLAEKLDITKGSVSQWESDHTVPDLPMFIRLVGALDKSADWLLFGETSSPGDEVALLRAYRTCGPDGQRRILRNTQNEADDAADSPLAKSGTE